jgi:hypothetical protein
VAGLVVVEVAPRAFRDRRAFVVLDVVDLI